MATTQIGYLGGVGPVFVDDTTVAGKKILLIGDTRTGALKAKSPDFAGNLSIDNAANATSNPERVFPYPKTDFALGPYSDEQTVGGIPAYKAPATSVNSYVNLDASWGTQSATTATPSPGTPATGGGGTPATGGGGTPATGGGGTVTAGGGGTVTAGGDTTFSAPTIMEQISTFLSNYWWLVLLIVGALLWKPFIAPALGMGGKKKRYR